MASVLSLPCELSLQISRLLNFRDKCNLSATCKIWRARLSPEIFNTIRFTNDGTSPPSTLLIAHGRYVKEIKFLCQCDLFDWLGRRSLSPEALKLLEGHLTPNVRTIRLRFDFGPDKFFDSDDMDVEDVEDADATRTQKMKHYWREIMRTTWKALAANTFVRALVVDELPLIPTSTYYTVEFRQFLAQLESATFNFYDVDDHVRIRTRSLPCTRDFLRNMDALFFRYMGGLKHLHIQALDPFDIPEHLPLLQSLKLENCFISSSLASFIQGHARVLESLDINVCVSSMEDFPEIRGDKISWADFFDEVYKAKPRLTELIAGRNKTPFTINEPDEHTDDAVQHILQKLKADPNFIAFRYVFRYQIFHDYDALNADERVNAERFYQGDDQRAYDRLMGLVNENRRRQGLI
ncbi:hypothetical protein ACQKWADRAFT_320488 [Trichoderma austrokoningii]